MLDVRLEDSWYLATFAYGNTACFEKGFETSLEGCSGMVAFCLLCVRAHGPRNDMVDAEEPAANLLGRYQTALFTA